MKLIRSVPSVIKSISADLTSQFIYVDIGCAYNGIDEPLLDFGDKLIAYAFDSNIYECQRLIEQNQNNNIHYVPGYVKLDPNHPFSIAKGSKSSWSYNPWAHLAVAKTLESIRPEKLNQQELSKNNLWSTLENLTKPDDIYLDRFLPEQGINNIDLCKIDVDGGDFDILHSLEPFFAKQKVLSIMIEVNFFGSDNEYDHTFHNVDRYLRKHGFDLYGLTVNKYSARSLPAPYYFTTGPGENLSGRPYQGDALYILDPFIIEPNEEKFLKLIALFSLFNLPDWAAEIIETYSEIILDEPERNKLLDLLTRQIQEGGYRYPDYKSYIAAFKKNDPYFYGGDIKQASIEADLNRLRTEVIALKASTSWRVTAPFRYLSQLFK